MFTGFEEYKNQVLLILSIGERAYGRGGGASAINLTQEQMLAIRKTLVY